MGQLSNLPFPRRRARSPRPQKRNYLLIEIVIALGLASIFLTVLFQFLVSNSRFEAGIEKVQSQLILQQRLRERIDSLFLSLASDPKIPPLYTVQFPGEKELSLIAHFDAGIDPDPAFSGPNTARVFIDEEKNLCFTQWPLEQEGHRTEILLSSVHSIEWEFLGPASGKEPGTTYISPSWAWLPNWKKEHSYPPSIIRLKIWVGIDKKKQREPNLQIAFILPNQEPIRIIKES